MHMMCILKYFRPLREKPDFPDPIGPLTETVPPTAIVKVNVKINKPELKKSSCKPGLSVECEWNILISDASAEV